MNERPPIGVIAPSPRIPVTASKYRLTEKKTTPVRSKAHTHKTAVSDNIIRED
jgi:hypothetical protein